MRHPLGVGVIRRDDDPTDDPFFQATGAICNLPVLTQAAGATGFLNAAPDPDGLLRRVPLLMELDGRVYPGLPLAAVSAVTGSQPVALRVVNANASSLVLDNRTRSPRRQEQSAAAFPRAEAHLPLCFGG